ncbi:MAG: hypothetical protein LOD89_01500 [Tissierellales bacterium]
MIKIDGVELPTPSEYTVGIQDLSKAERNARGTMIIERIATKRKIELSWKYLTREQLSQVLNLVAPVFFTVEYIDPQENKRKTGVFYCGDRSVSALDYRNGEIRWKDIKFFQSLIGSLKTRGWNGLLSLGNLGRLLPLTKKPPTSIGGGSSLHIIFSAIE